jgi:hypothetical protein
MLIDIPGNKWVDPAIVTLISVQGEIIRPGAGSPAGVRALPHVVITTKAARMITVEFDTEEHAANWAKRFAMQCNAISRTQCDDIVWKVTLQKITDNG